jgi:DNA-binding MarR family transcriptional regulator
MCDTLTRSVCNYAALRRATRGIGQLYDEALRESGISAAQYTLLSAISRLGAPTQGELAIDMVMDLSALGHTLKPLIRDGWVETRKDERDSRKRRIALSKIGSAKRLEAEALWRPAQRRFADLVGLEASKELRVLLDQIAGPDFAKKFAA